MASLNSVSGQNPRQIAARVLQCRRSGHEFIENLLENALQGVRLSSADRGLCQELTYGVVRWQATLDWLIARKTQGRTQKAALQDLLRLGLYQIFWLDRIPEHAAVHETVELAKQAGFGPQAGFINAVLRGYLRELDATRQLLTELKSTQPALGFSHPEWLVERWRQRWGHEHARQLLEWNNVPPVTCARVNTLRTDAAKLVAQWRAENVEYDFIRRDWCDENLAFELKSHPPLAKLASFQQGLFYVQDPSTLLAVREVAPKPGDAILDLCAAPGGKATYLAQLVQNEARIVAADVSDERLKIILENCARLGVTCVEAVLAEALFPAQAVGGNPPHEPLDCSHRRKAADLGRIQTRPPPHVGGYGSKVPCANLRSGNSLPQRGRGQGEGATSRMTVSAEGELASVGGDVGVIRKSGPEPQFVPHSHGMGEGAGGRAQFDRVLVDAPCSNTGVMRRRVDLRWRIKPEEIERLRATQLELLRQAAARLKTGGTLVYSTCSLEPEENREVVQQFLREQAGFKLERERELLPFADGVDGAYVAKIRR